MLDNTKCRCARIEHKICTVVYGLSDGSGYLLLHLDVFLLSYLKRKIQIDIFGLDCAAVGLMNKTVFIKLFKVASYCFFGYSELAAEVTYKYLSFNNEL